MKRKYYQRVIEIPAELEERYVKAEKQLKELNWDEYDMFIDDLITAMENRLKVLTK